MNKSWRNVRSRPEGRDDRNATNHFRVCQSLRSTRSKCAGEWRSDILWRYSVPQGQCACPGLVTQTSLGTFWQGRVALRTYRREGEGPVAGPEARCDIQRKVAPRRGRRFMQPAQVCWLVLWLCACKQWPSLGRAAYCTSSPFLIFFCSRRNLRLNRQQRAKHSPCLLL